MDFSEFEASLVYIVSFKENKNKTPNLFLNDEIGKITVISLWIHGKNQS